MYPLQSVLSKLDLSRWMLRWSMELSEYDINCRPQIALKGQVLADFLIEFTHEQHSNEDKQSLQEPEIWVLYVDGPLNQQGVGVGVYMETPSGAIDKSVTLCFEASNNEVEYEAMLHGLEMAQLLGARNLHVQFDSKLVVNQVQGHYDTKDAQMGAYLWQVR